MALSGTQVRRSITPRQREVLECIVLRMSIKEIAANLGISESTVNKHIRDLKQSMSANSHRELTVAYTRLTEALDSTAEALQSSGSSPATRISAVPDTSNLPDPFIEDADDAVTTLHDAVVHDAIAPWTVATEPTVVPRALDGFEAAWLRLALIVGITVGLLFALAAGLGAAQGIENVIKSRQESNQVSNG